ncbi:hypothetical protein [Thermomonospora cellulosilytica]|uniref:Uncharacterized protein n=1 Tax=Thermomonospora cellulosilytica TaxID=1411118 RepID=A0A7W3RAM6_9ACTN|nr:hypothetical protein [Thermomonospora cellulosilytica]MBA9006001.1 hypothetical protein [Thermomonospora cellulosilytica]
MGRRRRPHRSAPTCDLCGEPILWATTQAGYRQPLDPTPNAKGSVLAYKDHHGVLRSRAVSTAGPRQNWHPLEKVYMPHQATCQLKLQHPPTNVPLTKSTSSRRRGRNG